MSVGEGRTQPGSRNRNEVAPEHDAADPVVGVVRPLASLDVTEDAERLEPHAGAEWLFPEAHRREPFTRGLR